MDEERYFDDDIMIHDDNCPRCGHWTYYQECSAIGCEEGYIDEYEDDPINFSPGEEYSPCPECHGHGRFTWCPNCGHNLVTGTGGWPRVYTLGYGGRSLEEVVRLAEEVEATVVDIRRSARSRRPEFGRKRLEAALGERYVHLPQWGNVNYRQGGPIEIADLAGGLEALGEIEAEAVILMCACRDWQTCHRLVVAKELVERGYRVEELGQGE